MRFFDYAVALLLVAIVGLAAASMLGLPLGPLDPVRLLGGALDLLAQAGIISR